MRDPWLRIDAQHPDECWPWTGTIDKDGYGVFGDRGRQIRAARWVLAQKVGDLRDDEVTRHTCDNRACCNAAHLLRGTPADNTADMVERGRQNRGDDHWTRAQPDRLRRGQRNLAAKLTDADVVSIRRIYATGARQVDLAQQFGVTQKLVSDIVRHRIWTHLEAA